MSYELPPSMSGDVSPLQYEDEKIVRVTPNEFEPGGEYTMRFRWVPTQRLEYISDYPVRVLWKEQDEPPDGPYRVGLAFLEPRHRSWKAEETPRQVWPDGFMKMKNTGRNRVPQWPSGMIDTGYFLSYVTEENSAG